MISENSALSDPKIADLLPKRRNGIRFNLNLSDLVVFALLIGVMVFGGYLRFVGQNWDDFTHLHPDERFLTGVAEGVGRNGLSLSGPDKDARLADCQARYPQSNGIGGYFDTSCTNLYPPNIGYPLYVYGELPLFVVKGSALLYAEITNNQVWLGYNGIHFVGRTVSAVAELFTIFFIFLTARRLYGRWTGLLSAFLYAVAVIPIQLAHYWTADAFSNLPIAIAFFFAARTLDRGWWLDYIGFGVAFGAAIASRINTLPLIGVGVLAAMIYCLPVLDIRTPWSERMRLLSVATRGLTFMGIAAFLAFRILSPHAFTGWGFLGFFDIRPWPPFFEQIGQAQYQTSGAFDIPPNYQWVNRPQYIFAWRNIVLWGLGLPLGLLSWGAFILAGVQMLRGRRGWTRHALFFAWIFVYFGLIGRNWVASMRYFIVIYPALVTLAAWFMVEFAVNATKALQARPTLTKRLIQTWAVGTLIFVTLFSGLWGFGFSRIYTRQLTRVHASQWVLQNLPSAVSTVIKDDQGRTRLFNLPYGGLATGDLTKVLQLQRTAPMSGTIEEFVLPHVLNTTSQEPGRLTALEIYVKQVGGTTELAKGVLEADFTSTKTSKHGERFVVKLNQPVQLKKGDQYWIQVVTSGDALQLTGTVIATEGPWDDPIPWKVCQIPPDQVLSADTPSGLSGQTCEGVDGFGEQLYKGLELYLVAEDNEEKRQIIQRGMDEADYITISSNRFYDTLPRNPARFPMTTRFYDELFAGRLGFEVHQTFQSWITIGPFTAPDQHLPTDTSPEWLNEWESEEAFSVYDHPVVYLLKKRDGYTNAALREVLYGTNISQQDVIPVGAYESPLIAGKVNWPSNSASAAPTAFMLTPEQLRIQASGGTWSELFNRNSPLNTNQLIGLLAFYFTVLIFGWITWPLLASLLPALPDKAYPVAKFAGMVIVSWIAWVGGTMGLLTWTSPGILLIMVLITVVSVILGLRNRNELLKFLNSHRRYLLIVEGFTLILFLGFLFVRLGNPDLWAQSLGGEKPMDFSYWNAVMRSTIFPPYDPWYSGGYLNYYYYGYVIVGTPIKLIGIMPQIAYNLILPMLFAVTGMGAFSVAYNIVAARGVYPRDDGDSSPDASGLARRRWALRTPHGSPILAGIAAALMCVVLGNLDTPRIIMGSIAQAGGYTPTDVYTQLVREFEVNNGRAPTAEEANKLKDEAIGPNPIESFRLGVNEFGRWAGGLVKGFESISRLGYIPVGADRWFWGPSRVLGELPGASSEITEFPAFTFIYADLHAHMIAMPIQLLAILWLLGEVLAAERTRPRYAVIGATAFGGLVVGILFPTNTWDWITYMLLAIVGLTFAVWLRAGQARSAPHGIGTERERGVGAWLSFILNKLTRRSVMEYLAILVGFFIAQQIAGQPFRAFFATGFTSVNAFAGNKSPIWAFLIIHGLFIFLITSLLVWQTIRALRRTYVKDIIGNRRAVLLILSGLLIIVVVTLVFTVLTTQIAIPSRQGGDRILFDPPYPAALLVIPLLGWSIILFFLPDQSREMRVVLAINMLILSLIMGAEMVTLANDSGRQNTIFKLYMQVWVMFACIGGVALAWLVRASERWGTIQRSFWLGAAASLFAIAGLFPLMASQGKIAVRMAPNAPRTLDGLEYMKYATYAYGGTLIPLAGDHAIITWLQDNVRGTPVILEAQLPEYQLGSRIVSNTGLPTVLGYRYHQSQQRSLEPMGTLIWGRVGNIASAYNTTDYDTVRAILRHYNVEYIIVGGLERAVYKPEGLQKFEAMVAAGELEVVYAPKKVEGDVSTSIDQDRIYRVLPRAKQFVDVAVVGGGQ